MSFEVVELPATYVTGYTIRTNNQNEQDPATGWILKTWQRVRQEQFAGAPAAALLDYENNSAGYFSEVIGHECGGQDDLEPSQVLAKIPAGSYAKFTASGQMPNIVLDTWKTVWQAEKSGDIKRSYTTDFERYPNNHTVELYIAIAE